MNLDLKTPRLTLKPFRPADVDIALELFTSHEVLRFTGGVMTPEAVRAEMHHWVRRGGNGCIGVWCVTRSETGEKLGTGALLPMPIEEEDTNWDLLVPGRWPDAEIEVGYFLKPSAWGRGYATEVCKALLRLAFEETPLQEVAASYDEGNDASRNVLLKSGFVDHGTRICYAEESPDLRISRDEWLESC